MSFDPDTALPLIVCPKSHASLVHEGTTLVSTDAQTRLQYEIRDGIPVLLVDEATELSPEQWGDIMQKHGRSRTTGEVTEPTNGQQE